MVYNLVHDLIFLAIKSAPASQDYLQMAKDLLDTLKTRSILAVA